MKGVMFKYDADPNDPELKDNQSACSGKNCGIRDPDFWSNDVPVWGICGPYVRTSLEKGDILFFLPKKWSWKKADLQDYICAGILVVNRVLPNVESVLNCNLLTDSYKREWKNDLNAHLRNDKPRTKNIRGKKFIIGNPKSSIWIGRHENYLKDTLTRTGLGPFTSKIAQRKIPYLNNDATENLFRKLMSQA